MLVVHIRKATSEKKAQVIHKSKDDSKGNCILSRVRYLMCRLVDHATLHILQLPNDPNLVIDLDNQVPQRAVMVTQQCYAPLEVF